MNLKAQPEDFVVEEIPTEGFERSMKRDFSERYLVVRACKRDCAHFDLVRAITKRFVLPESDVGIGGIKDRRAITTQLLTLPNAVRIRDSFVGPSEDQNSDSPSQPKHSARTTVRDAAKSDAESEPLIIALPTMTGEATLELLGSTPRRMTIGTLYANRFVIRATITDDERAVLSRYREEGEALVPNYFGSQRFGRNRENPSIGYALLRGDYEFVRDTLLSNSDEDPLSFVRRISRRKRMFYISAFQSALYNVELIEHIEPGVIGRLEAAPNDERIGALARLADERVYASRYDLPDTIPIVSLGAEPNETQERLLQMLDISPRSFAIRQMPDLMFEPVERASLVRVVFERFELDDELVVSFTLPKGSYATVVLEALTARLRSHP
ncbi:MAG: tRNA pseudouridine(13) synthase TruD [Candidatus Woesearchaeota archaeon]